MPRRGGKAASRRARHRPPRRPVIRQPELGVQAPPPRRAEDDDSLTDATVVPPVGTPDAREAASLGPPRPAPPPVYAGASRLSERAAAEYHYVVLDLRNIAILTVILAVLLAAAAIAFPALGLVAR